MITVEAQVPDAANTACGPLAVIMLPVHPESAHYAREWLGLTLDIWAICDIEDAQLCIAELVANVVRHASDVTDVMRVVISRFPKRIRVDVYDSSDDTPKLNESTQMRESGNGLFLIDAIVGRAQWGFHLMKNSKGKCVWFAIPWAGSDVGGV